MSHCNAIGQIDICFFISERRCLHLGRQRPRQRHQRLHDGQWQAAEERRPATFECWRETHFVKWRERGVHLTPAASTNTPHHQKLTHTHTLLGHNVCCCVTPPCIKSECFSNKNFHQLKQKLTPTTSMLESKKIEFKF